MTEQECMAHYGIKPRWSVCVRGHWVHTWICDYENYSLIEANGMIVTVG